MLCVVAHVLCATVAYSGWRSLFFTMLNMFADRILQADAINAPGRYIDNALEPGGVVDKHINRLLQWILNQPLPSNQRALQLPVAPTNASAIIDDEIPIDAAHYMMKPMAATDLLLDV
jgi:hypothetical protein